MAETGVRVGVRCVTLRGRDGLARGVWGRVVATGPGRRPVVLMTPDGSTRHFAENELRPCPQPPRFLESQGWTRAGDIPRPAWARTESAVFRLIDVGADGAIRALVVWRWLRGRWRSVFEEVMLRGDAWLVCLEDA